MENGGKLRDRRMKGVSVEEKEKAKEEKET